jgi:hypothetical protein
VSSSDDKPTRQEKARASLQTRREAQDIRDVMQLAAGRRLFVRIMELTKIHATTFTGEPLSSAYNEGMRSVGLYLRDDFIEADYDHVCLAEREARAPQEELDV